MPKFLQPDKVRTEYGLTIREKLIPDGSRFKPNRPLLHGKVEYVTIHNTNDINEAEGTNDAEQYARATHNGAMGDVSVHYYIDETDCWQLLREDEMGYHAADGNTGGGNGTSLAIEIIMDGSGDKTDAEAEDRGALLAAILLHRHGLTIDKLKTHNDWYPKKYCPAYILPHWYEFVAKVRDYKDAIEKPGDVDRDGKVTTKDARLALRAAIGLENLRRVQRVAADVDRNNKIDTKDAREILRKSIGLGGKKDG
jgi:N-acetylmuramoyl-L-alanine amidase CwlA